VLVLASASPRRRALLAEAGLSHRVLPVDIDETPPPGERPEQVAVLLARRKALAASRVTPERPLVAADTIVVLDGRLLGKPADRNEARATLRALSGRRHDVITGMCVLTEGAIRLRAVITEVWFRRLTEKEIEDYVATGEPMDKAGSYGIQGRAGKFVARLRGSRSNVIGLPVEELREML